MAVAAAATEPSSLRLCFLFLSLVAHTRSAHDSGGFHSLRGLGGHLAVPEAPRGFRAAAGCLDSLGQCALCRGALAAGRPGRKQEKVVSCRSLLKLLTESHSAFGKCSERFYFQCLNFSGFRELLLSRKKVVISPPPSPCGVTAPRLLSPHPTQCCFFFFFWVT